MADTNQTKPMKPFAKPVGEASAEKAFDAAVTAATQANMAVAGTVAKAVKAAKAPAKPKSAIEVAPAPAIELPQPVATPPAAAPVVAAAIAPAAVVAPVVKTAVRRSAKAATTVADQLGTAAKAAMADAVSIADRMSDAAEEAASAPTNTPVSVAYEPTSAPAKAAADTVKGLFKMATNPQMFGDMSDRAKGMFEKSSKMSEELVEFTKGNVEALVSSARVAAKGSEAMAQEAAEYGKKSFESATAAFKGMASVKSPTELFQLQSEFAKSSFDSAVAEASKVSENVLKLWGEMFQPLSNRYAVASEKMKVAAL